jgi:Rne/Rng family ribonuclease
MNKELFVSSTPHETKVGLVEDDLLAEIYLERENEYTLAGSIYKGRVTRVLPGMQSAFVDIGLERDAFLYVSDFMELEDQDEDLTEAVPANRGVQDLRPPAQVGPAAEAAETEETESRPAGDQSPQHVSGGDTSHREVQASTGASQESPGDSQNRDRGGWRGRRRRRGGRGGRGDGPDHGPEPRYSRPTGVSTPPRQDSGRAQQFGPPAGYQPILLPGESISKYQRLAQQPGPTDPQSQQERMGLVSSGASEHVSPLASSFPEDEPFFADTANVAEPLHEQHDDMRPAQEETESGSTSVDWNREFRRPESTGTGAAAAWAPQASARKEKEEVVEEVEEDASTPLTEHSEPLTRSPREEQAPDFARPGTIPGTIEEETIDEEETDTVHYEQASDDGDEEFEEETRAAGQPVAEHLNSDAREAVTEIHMSSLAEAGELPAPEEATAEGEDSEELELEEAQAEAEALLDAEARASGTVDARAEVRAPAPTAGYVQRAPRPAFDRRGPRGRRGGRRFRRRESQEVPKISDLLKEGQEILVQIAKEPIGKKGARITSHIALPGRFLVYMPTVNHTGVSRKIASEEERQRLKRIILSERENGHGGFIVRTAAQNASEEELRADIRFLKGLWNDIKTRSESSKPPALIYHDLNVVERVLRDQVTSDFSVIWVDTEPEYERIVRFFNRFQPALVKRVKLYTKETPLFEQFGLAEEMNKALKSKVWLKSGGYIVINQTEALVAIDINTGKYVGKTQRLEDTIVKTNVDAIKEIVRQIRLRDLGGIIIIDFIDMDERRNRQRVMQALEEELRHDRAPSKTLQFNDFGLVAITRKRVKQSLERTIGAPCPYCQSTGYVKSVSTVCNEIYVEMRKIARHLEHEDVMLRVNPDVAKELKSNNGRLLNEMEELTKRTIIVKSDPALHQEQFDIN